ncbi:hypothetical protein WJX72_003738 [[Myrmecia] bisecta]|uniref:C2H2-type domain-containing protein n=1 Tax=[Myrmecia] bisecta TaxID=41462 RepID=A0AAW1PEE2_9CHLO
MPAAPQAEAPPDPAAERFHCPFEGCTRSFMELWRLKVHYRAAPDVRGSGRERGHGMELEACPKCCQVLKPGKHHVGCFGVGALSQPEKPANKRHRSAAGFAETTSFLPGEKASPLKESASNTSSQQKASSLQKAGLRTGSKAKATASPAEQTDASSRKQRMGRSRHGSSGRHKTLPGGRRVSAPAELPDLGFTASDVGSEPQGSSSRSQGGYVPIPRSPLMEYDAYGSEQSHLPEYRPALASGSILSGLRLSDAATAQRRSDDLHIQSLVDGLLPSNARRAAHQNPWSQAPQQPQPFSSFEVSMPDDLLQDVGMPNSSPASSFGMGLGASSMGLPMLHHGSAAASGAPGDARAWSLESDQTAAGDG